MAQLRASKQLKKYTQQDWEWAVEFKLAGNISDRQIQRETGVPAQTLRDYIKNNAKHGQVGRPTILTVEEERTIADYVFLRQDMHAPM